MAQHIHGNSPRVGGNDLLRSRLHRKSLPFGNNRRLNDLRREGNCRRLKIRHHTWYWVQRVGIVSKFLFIKIANAVKTVIRNKFAFSNDEDDSWKATWYVTSREDIGDFYIVLREIGKKPLIEQDVVYSERSYKVHTLPKSMSKYELCVLARDSIGNVKHFRDSQCQLLNQKFTSSGSSSLPLSAISLVLLTSLTLMN